MAQTATFSVVMVPHANDLLRHRKEHAKSVVMFDDAGHNI